MTTLLLVHAFPVDASMWDAQLAALGEDVQVVSPSLPGFGGTAPAGEVLTVESMADFLAGALDEAGVDRAVVCGLSMGGYAALALWRAHRERVAGLALADTRAEPDDDPGKERRRRLADTVVTEGSGWLAENPPPLLSEGADRTLWEWVRETIRKQPAEAIAAASRGMAERPDSRPILPEIDVPTTVIVGSGDTLTPPAMSVAMATVIPGAELAVIEDAGHLSNLERPEAFTAAVRALLQRAE